MKKNFFSRLHLTTKKFYINKLNNKPEILTYTIKISQNIKLFIKISKIILEKLYKNNQNYKKLCAHKLFKYINNQHYINKIISISKLSN